MATVKVKVIGDSRIAGASKGETVELDSEVYNIDALVDGGHVERMKTQKRDE